MLSDTISETTESIPVLLAAWMAQKTPSCDAVFKLNIEAAYNHLRGFQSVMDGAFEEGSRLGHLGRPTSLGEAWAAMKPFCDANALEGSEGLDENDPYIQEKLFAELRSLCNAVDEASKSSMYPKTDYLVIQTLAAAQYLRLSVG